MENIDYTKNLRSLYAPSAKKISLVDVPSMNFIWAEGKGDPNTSHEYREIVEALYAVSYTIKFMVKKGKGKINYRVMPLEGLWWVPKMETFSIDRKDQWLWRMMIMQPEPVTEELFTEAVETVRSKKHPAAIDAISFGSFSEGQCAQLLYVGPYHDEGPTISRLHGYIAGLGGRRTGRHHEIYLNDPRKTAPEKLRTIIRQPLTHQK
jgi:hypothetical protein